LILEDFWWKNQGIWIQDEGGIDFPRFNRKRYLEYILEIISRNYGNENEMKKLG